MKTDIVVLIDRSGSMASIRADMEGGFNTFIEKQRKEPGEATVTLATFDTTLEYAYVAKPLAYVPPLVITPRGSTALLDSFAKLINDTGDRLRKTTHKPDRVLFIVVTDGQENASREMKRQAVLDMVKHQSEKYSWEFVYIGANQDAISEGLSMGVANQLTYIPTGKGIHDMWAVTSNSTSSYRAGTGYAQPHVPGVLIK